MSDFDKWFDEITKAVSAKEEKVCQDCDGGGWTLYGIGHSDPHFRVCETCGNPEGLTCP